MFISYLFILVLFDSTEQIRFLESRGLKSHKIVSAVSLGWKEVTFNIQYAEIPFREFDWVNLIC